MLHDQSQQIFIKTYVRTRILKIRTDGPVLELELLVAKVDFDRSKFPSERNDRIN